MRTLEECIHNAAQPRRLTVVLAPAARCATGDKLRDFEEYAVPYAGMVPADPSFDQMRELVSVQRVRPPVPQRWTQHKVRACRQARRWGLRSLRHSS